MVPFAGYLMPVQYPAGIMAEHLHCRAGAALFDVSHMGQAELVGEGAAAALEALTPSDVSGLKPGRQRYALITTMLGGIFDDFMVANLGDRLFVVVNAGRKAQDFALIGAALPPSVRMNVLADRALLACRGRRPSRRSPRSIPASPRCPSWASAASPSAACPPLSRARLHGRGRG
jgi:aminomethyltransferase